MSRTGVFGSGKALIIRGPQGSGKSTIAREIAKARGPYVETTLADIDSPFELGRLMAHDPATIIVDEVGCFSRFLDRAREKLKDIVRSHELEVHRRGQNPRTVASPNIIILSSSSDPVPSEPGARRFMVCRSRRPQRVNK